MKRSIALCALLAGCAASLQPTQVPFATSPQEAVPDTTSTAPTAPENIRQWQQQLSDFEHWSLASIGAQDDFVIFVNDTIRMTPAGTVIAYVRTETEVRTRNFLSFATTVEVDCRNYRARTLEESGFYAHNLNGEGVRSGRPNGAWSYPQPKSVGSGVIDATCKIAAARTI